MSNSKFALFLIMNTLVGLGIPVLSGTSCVHAAAEASPKKDSTKVSSKKVSAKVNSKNNVKEDASEEVEKILESSNNNDEEEKEVREEGEEASETEIEEDNKQNVGSIQPDYTTSSTRSQEFVRLFTFSSPVRVPNTTNEQLDETLDTHNCVPVATSSGGKGSVCHFFSHLLFWKRGKYKADRTEGVRERGKPSGKKIEESNTSSKKDPKKPKGSGSGDKRSNKEHDDESEIRGRTEAREENGAGAFAGAEGDARAGNGGRFVGAAAVGFTLGAFVSYIFEKAKNATGDLVENIAEGLSKKLGIDSSDSSSKSNKKQTKSNKKTTRTREFE
ncbi:MAG: hypothetical protein LBB24_00870 [Rickettsiales bacterium]|jgi:hypothetical protein|nr:hypothetical protein [Rickettsiales bacterium]